MSEQTKIKHSPAVEGKTHHKVRWIVLAVLLVTEARHRLRSRAIPKAFRGLPITLVYIGVLALAIYGFTGHSVIL